MADRSALQTPFDDAVPTPAVGGTGLNGLGNGLDLGRGGSGLIQSPWTDKPVPTAGGSPTGGGDLPTPPDRITLEGGTYTPVDITSMRNTIDKR